MSLLNFLATIFFDSFSNYFVNDFANDFADENVFLNGKSDEPHIVTRNINPRDCSILDNGVFEKILLANEPFPKAL